MNKPIAIAIAAVLLGGVAVAAYRNNPFGDYAEVISAVPVTEQVPIVGEVVSATPVTELVQVPTEVCEDQQVQYQQPPKDPNKLTGTIAGAVVGGLLGNQIGGGSGKKLATVAGAAGGAYAGRRIQASRQEANTVTRTERVCQTVTETKDQVIGYDVVYRLDGETASTRAKKKPGATIQLGKKDEIVGYEVTYRYKGQVDTVRTEEDPGKRLPVEDGVVQVGEARG